MPYNLTTSWVVCFPFRRVCLGKWFVFHPTSTTYCEVVIIRSFVICHLFASFVSLTTPKAGRTATKVRQCVWVCACVRWIRMERIDFDCQRVLSVKTNTRVPWSWAVRWAYWHRGWWTHSGHAGRRSVHTYTDMYVPCLFCALSALCLCVSMPAISEVAAIKLK